MKITNLRLHPYLPGTNELNHFFSLLTFPLLQVLSVAQTTWCTASPDQRWCDATQKADPRNDPGLLQRESLDVKISGYFLSNNDGTRCLQRVKWQPFKLCHQCWDNQVNSMATDDLVMQGARTSAAMVLTLTFPVYKINGRPVARCDL